MIEFLLTIHLLGAIATIVYVIAAAIILLRPRRSSSRLGQFASGIVVVQILSGLGLALMSPLVSLAAVCLRGLLLIGFILVMQMAVRWRLAPEHELYSRF